MIKMIRMCTFRNTAYIWVTTHQGEEVTLTLRLGDCVWSTENLMRMLNCQSYGKYSLQHMLTQFTTQG